MGKNSCSIICENKRCGYTCIAILFLLGLGCIIQLFFVPPAVEDAFFDALNDRIVMTQAQQDANTEEYQEWISNYNDDAPLQLFEFWLYNVTNPMDVPKGDFPSFELIGPFTYRRYENKSGPGNIEKPVFYEEADESLVEFDYHYHFEYDPDRSVDVSLDEMVYTISGAMQGFFANINQVSGSEPAPLPCIDEGLGMFPGDAVFAHQKIGDYVRGFRDPYLEGELDELCDGFLWELIRPNTLYSLIADGVNRVIQHTGLRDITKIAELETFRNFTTPLTNSDKLVPGDLWLDHNETVAGSRETRQFPPNYWVTKDKELKVWSQEKFRVTAYTYDREVRFKGADLLRFRLDDAELYACEYTFDNACSQSPTVQPTKEPTEPTINPTTATPTGVTQNPTMSPTAEPTEDTMAPTTAIPTEDTISPTNDPTMEPTLAPTFEPSADTQSPSESPTLDTQSPTQQPTDEPTADTVAPTGMPSMSPTCAFVTNESHTCKYYQYWEDGIANLTNLRGSPSFMSKGRFLDAPYFIENTNRAFGLSDPEPEEDDQYFDIDPRTGLVLRNFHNYQINFRFLQMDRSYPNNFTNFSIFNRLIPFAYIRVEGIATDEQMEFYTDTIAAMELINRFSVYGGPALGVVFFGLMFFILCKMKQKEYDGSNGNGQYGRLVESSNNPAISMQKKDAGSYGATNQ